jgi:hypothetical protein
VHVHVSMSACVSACLRVCVCACVRMCVCVCACVPPRRAWKHVHVETCTCAGTHHAISSCAVWIWLETAGVQRGSTLGSLRIVPSPLQGTSANTRSNPTLPAAAAAAAAAAAPPAAPAPPPPPARPFGAVRRASPGGGGPKERAGAGSCSPRWQVMTRRLRSRVARPCLSSAAWSACR